MSTEARRRRSPTAALQLAAMAVLAYLPVLLTEPGRVAADTKQYLYLDPGRLLASAPYLWDPSTSGGTVTFQNIGYLLPQGPFYWVLAEVGVPTWVAQRLWLGTLLFAAGAGVWYLARLLGLGRRRPSDVAVRECEYKYSDTHSREGNSRAGGRAGAGGPRPGGAARTDGSPGDLGPFVAALAYMLSPYFLQYSSLLSALLLPWCGLGWMLAFTVRALRRGGWRDPALFGIVVALVGGTNATSLLYAGVAPLLYLPYAVLATHEASWRRALAAAARIGAASVAVSLWWLAALAVGGSYGLDVLKYTETVPSVATTSSPQEVLRGLGYWLFYGAGTAGPWISASVQYETEPWLVAVSFAVPALAVLAGVLTRWRHRAYFAVLGLVGLALSVGTYPYSAPSLLGRWLKAFMTGTTAGFALRSTDRAAPLLVLGLAMLLGAGVSAAAARWGSLAGAAAALVAVGLTVANALPLVTGAAVQASDTRTSQLPAYVEQAARYLDAGGDATRVLFEPGESDAGYDFGTTDDSIWPGVLTRPEIERLQLVSGGAATVDLLEALDLTLQDGTFEPSSLAPVARLLSAGDVVLQSELAYWAYGIPRPRETWPLFESPPPGLGPPASFGPSVGDDAPADLQDVDPQELALPASSPDPPALAVFPVTDPRSIYRAEPASDPLVVNGSGAGLVAAAATGLLDDNPTIVYAGSLDGDAALREEVETPGSQLLLTDTNAKVLQRWSTLSGNIGEVETNPPAPTGPDPSAVPLVLFPGAPADAYTTTVYKGAVYVTASSYGNAFTFTPEDRAANAFDGNLNTAWTVSPLASPAGQWIQIELPRPVTASQLNLVQPLQASASRWIDRASLSFDGGPPVEEALDAASRGASGQLVRFGTRTFRTLRITIDRTAGPGTGGVGLAEVRIPGVQVQEMLALPTDLLDSLGSSSLSHRLTILLDRDRVGPASGRSDPETHISRLLSLPTARAFTVSGTAVLSASAPDEDVDELLGGAGALGGTQVFSSSRLAGDLDARGVFAFDGDSSTAWVDGFGAGDQQGAWVQADLTHSVSFDHLDLKVVDDGQHSLPTAVRISAGGGPGVVVRLPPLPPGGEPAGVATVRVRFPELTGKDVRLTVVDYRAVHSASGNGGSQVLPIGIAEVGIPGVRVKPENPSAPLPDVCRADLLTIDGKPVDVRLVGTVGEAESLSQVRFVGCGDSAHGVSLGAGAHVLETALAGVAQLQLDRVVLDSAPGGSPMPLGPGDSLTPVPGTVASRGSPALPAPTVRVLASSPTSARVEVSGATGPFWLVLGESQSAGWVASVEGDSSSLGPSVLIDGMSNGWYVRAPPLGKSFVVDISFAPQGEVWTALALSGAALLAYLLLAVWPRRRRRADAADPAGAPGAAADRAAGAPAGPEIGSLVATAGRRPRPLVIAGASIAAGAVAAALPAPPYGPALGVATALVTAAALFWSRGRVLLVAAAVGAALGVVLDTALGEELRRLHSGTGWAASFPLASVLTWVVLLALAVDGLVELARRAPPAPPPPAPPAAPEPSDPT